MVYGLLNYTNHFNKQSLFFSWFVLCLSFCVYFFGFWYVCTFLVLGFLLKAFFVPDPACLLSVLHLGPHYFAKRHTSS